MRNFKRKFSTAVVEKPILAWSDSELTSLAAFGDAPTIRCERAIAELRAGRPILLKGAGEALVAQALDGCTPGAYAAFARAAGGEHCLFVTQVRAAVIGLDSPDGAVLRLGGASLAEAIRLGYGRGPFGPVSAAPATRLPAAAARLARLGLLLPSLLLARVSPAQAADGLAEVTLDDLEAASISGQQAFQIVARTHVPLRRLGDAEFVVFRGGLAQRDQVAVIVGQPDPAQMTPVRVHSACLTGDLFGSLKCDCGDQLRRGMDLLHARGGGVLLYLDQEGRGSGIAAKLRAYEYQHQGVDTIDADALLGFGPDERRYTAASAMLHQLGFSRIELLTNNPGKVEQLRAGGAEVVRRLALTGAVTAENEGYLRTKAARAGHLMDVDALIETLDSPPIGQTA